MTSIALATCAVLPDLAADDRPLLAGLQAAGVDARAVVWDDPEVDWAGFDLVVLRSTWDYAKRRDEFLAWAERASQATRFANPFPVVRWNSDKHYLMQLAEAGVAVVPTQWLEPERRLNSHALHTRFPALGDFVIKPAVSAGSLDTGRYTAIDATSRGLAIRHARRLLDDGRTAMVQRYLKSVDTVGERAHVFLGGEYSHSVLKGAMLDGPDVANEGLYRAETMSQIEATEAEIATAGTVIQAARRLLTGSADGVEMAPEPFLYARVDLVSADDDTPVLMELELVEPSLFLGMSPGATERLVAAILARVS